MSDSRLTGSALADLASALSAGARAELEALGLTALVEGHGPSAQGLVPVTGRPPIAKRAIRAPEVLNEAHDYHPRPSSFSRGMRVDLGEASLLFLSGTASVGEDGETVYPGDFRAQCLRTFRNLTHLLVSEGASWHDVVRTTCYLRDIERDYAAFNEMRTMFMAGIGLDPLPASTGVQARLCRADLLVEIEAIAVVSRQDATG
jgi:enamine deaminase RidA (YjgF/YER057c/UK114 family)